jgi:predicted nucleic acid-binding protein
MKVYLDNCMFNRPFDNQTNLRVRIETESKLFIQEKIKLGELLLIWSYILDFENSQNPFAERQQAIAKWQYLASIDIDETTALLENARFFVASGIKPKDALHVACAIEGQADYFLSTDDKLLKKLATLNRITAMNPVDFIKVLDA